ncbi:hypothetical protein GXB85_08475 [Cellulomonas sp. APG4]|uniref:SIR2 family protein n=1 Tax=Cellulomonas sp. APG4 TaxID=1538656 RepID=UPI001379FB0B|nr:SIR2 family protein [Cellulomonas sp. APG4]NCT90979.1 hypothetical protein [Cellulomonas sp. APG4]
MNDTGHVFVVRGRLENLDCDAVVIPTDRAFNVETTWAPALGVNEPRAGYAFGMRPHDWETKRWGRSTVPGDGQVPVWFTDVAVDPEIPWDATDLQVDAVVTRLASVLEDAARNAKHPQNDRPRPLIAVPTLGVSRGGFGRHRGAMIQALLQTCEDAVARLPIDVVVVAFNPADHSAFQALRRQRAEPPGDEVRRLAELARGGSLALFVGAGVSASAGLPSWTGLLEELTARLPEDVGVAELASPLDQAQLLRNVMDPTGDTHHLGEHVREIVTQQQRYGLAHALVASLGCDHVVTTNYDELYEKAVRDLGEDAVVVLPGEANPPSKPWLLKMHGSVTDPSKIVLSRADFVGFHARSGPFGAVVQSLMLTEHLLVVGSSMTDDNVLRLAHEVLAVRGKNEAFATVVTFDVPAGLERLWENSFTFVTVGEGSGDRPREGRGRDARRLAIFLDTVAMHAAPTRHVLDGRYLAVLDDRARDAALQARALRKSLRALPVEMASDFAALSAALDELGAGGPDPDRGVSGSWDGLTDSR